MHPKRGELYRLKPKGRGTTAARTASDAEREQEPEEDGKPRPIVIVLNDKLSRGDSVLAVPFTSKKLEERKKRPWYAFFHKGEGGLDKDSVAKGASVTEYLKTRVDIAAGPIGKFDDAQMARLFDAVNWAMGFEKK